MTRSSLSMLLSASVAAITFRPLPPRPPDGFGALEESIYRGVVIFTGVVTIFEVPVLHWLVSHYLGGHTWLHPVILILHALALLWLLGDLRLMQSSWHRVDDDGLHVHLGLRWRGRIPLEQIESARVGAAEEASPLDPPPQGVARISPLEAPNVTLSLRAPQAMDRPRRAAPFHELRLFVDAPHDLVAAIEAARARL